MMNVEAAEHPMSIQIFGGSKETLVEAAKFIDQKKRRPILLISIWVVRLIKWSRLMQGLGGY